METITHLFPSHDTNQGVEPESYSGCDELSGALVEDDTARRRGLVPFGIVAVDPEAGATVPRTFRRFLFKEDGWRRETWMRMHPHSIFASW